VSWIRPTAAISVRIPVFLFQHHDAHFIRNAPLDGCVGFAWKHQRNIGKRQRNIASLRRNAIGWLRRPRQRVCCLGFFVASRSGLFGGWQRNAKVPSGVLVIILVIFLLGGFSGRFGGYGYGYGHGGVGVIGVILIILVVLLLTGRL